MMTIEQAIAKNVTERLKAQGLTQKDLHKLSGVSCTCINGYLKMRTGARLSRIYFIAKALGCTVNDLLEGCEE